MATFEDFPSIKNRLARKITEIAKQDEYVLIGHSLGGVLIRGALAALPPGTRLPNRVFLLGSPIRSSRVARFFQNNWIFRIATRDCGRLLSSDERMEQVEPTAVPTTSIVGTRGLYGRFSPFGDEVNDGIVSASEISADWISEVIHVPTIHTYMPSNKRVSQLVIERLHMTEK
jgi:hypothetical protein